MSTNVDLWSTPEFPDEPPLDVELPDPVQISIPKALSLHQPWASLIAAKAKWYETRSWRTHYRGTIAIHASGTFPAIARQWGRSQVVQDCLGGRELDVGCVVAIADLTDCKLIGQGTARSLSPQEVQFGNYTPGRWMWKLENIRELQLTVYCKGRQGLWNIMADLEWRILEQLHA